MDNNLDFHFNSNLYRNKNHEIFEFGDRQSKQENLMLLGEDFCDFISSNEKLLDKQAAEYVQTYGTISAETFDFELDNNIIDRLKNQGNHNEVPDRYLEDFVHYEEENSTILSNPVQNDRSLLFDIQNRNKEITNFSKEKEILLPSHIEEKEDNLNFVKDQNREDNFNKFPGFRTAEEELHLQNLKKNGNTSTQVNQALFDYGMSKKTLGYKRNGRGGFVPPIKKLVDDTEKNGKPVTTEKNSSKVVDDRLKNIDPEMIEMISNEIMHKFKPIDWDDIAGLDYAKSIIQEAAIWPLLRPDIFSGLRRPPRGILLFGPPGTGKTLIGKCIASKSKSTFFSISASSLTSKWVGDGEKMVRALFAVAAVNQPSVVFIDEIDSLLCQRSESEHESSRRIKTEFLVQLDGAATSEEERILIVGATNRPQELDEAARRRLVRRLYIPLPEQQARNKMLKKLLSSVKNVLTEEDMANISKLTDGYSGADIEVLCKEASMEPIRSIPIDELSSFDESNLRPVTSTDFQMALSRVRASVSQNDIKQYIEWNKTYGSGNTR